MNGEPFRTTFRVADYDLAATLDSGQAFRWGALADGWEGVIHGRWVRLEQAGPEIRAATVEDPGDWGWLRDYLAMDDDWAAIAATFPDDPALRLAAEECRGLRILHQEPWECLASFILSSTKQISQIRQIVGVLAERHGRPVAVPPGRPPAWAFPTAEALAGVSEPELRQCKMGFRARYLLGTAQAVSGGTVELAGLQRLPLAGARERLMALPGVGRKIADCVLLFGCGFPAAFPVDVWVLRVLRELYFPRRQPKPARLLAFSESHFGPYGGHAQQVLFHWRRRRAGRVASSPGPGAASPEHGTGD